MRAQRQAGNVNISEHHSFGSVTAEFSIARAVDVALPRFSDTGNEANKCLSSKAGNYFLDVPLVMAKRGDRIRQIEGAGCEVAGIRINGHLLRLHVHTKGQCRPRSLRLPQGTGEDVKACWVSRCEDVSVE